MCEKCDSIVKEVRKFREEHAKNLTTTCDQSTKI